MARYLVVTLAILVFPTLPSVAGQRPNVLIVMVDDLGFSDLGCYGSEIETPNLDRLAAGGLRFSQFYNTAKCHSSRISLLTGQYAFQAGNTKLSNGVTSAEVLGNAGYDPFRELRLRPSSPAKSSSGARRFICSSAATADCGSVTGRQSVFAVHRGSFMI